MCAPQCAVCLDTREADSFTVKLEHCPHLFHRHCVKHCAECPLCRRARGKMTPLPRCPQELAALVRHEQARERHRARRASAKHLKLDLTRRRWVERLIFVDPVDIACTRLSDEQGALRRRLGALRRWARHERRLQCASAGFEGEIAATKQRLALCGGELECKRVELKSLEREFPAPA